MKNFFNIVYILTVAHDTAAFVFTPQSSCISNCRIYNEKYRAQSPSLKKNLFELNEKKNENDKLVEGEETKFVDALKSALQEVWMLKDDEETKQRISDLVKSILRRLANLSLMDYQWRSDFFKRSEADRRVEESLARMMGEEASYLRPMDAGDEKIGPMGRAEKKLVEWLSLVIEEEGRRARMISSSEGELVRPIDLEGSAGGPLSRLETSAVNFIDSIRTSEEERAKTKTLRPKDLTEEKRGPLGNFELKVVNALDVIRNSEKLRMEQSRKRGGEVVRPIDVPGPLGELELWYLELVTAERQRSLDIRNINSGKLIRPKDGTIPGPMGKAERDFSEQLNLLKAEETERLKSFKKVLKENRPMEKDRNSPLGLIETILVGIIRGPQLIFRVIDRTKELLESEKLSEFDEKKSN